VAARSDEPSSATSEKAAMSEQQGNEHEGTKKPGGLGEDGTMSTTTSHERPPRSAMPPVDAERGTAKARPEPGHSRTDQRSGARIALSEELGRMAASARSVSTR
jgi:hypothetical protein